MICLLYHLLHMTVYRAKRVFGILHTKWRLIGNSVQYANYRIVGTPIIEISGNGRIVLGDNLQMNNGMLDNQIGYNNPCILRAENGSILIGKNVGMSQTTLVAKNVNITIGCNVKIGGGVKVYTTDFHSLHYEDRRESEYDTANRKCAPVVIDDDCFIGAGSIILKGVHIGARTIIGAGSVVTKDIPADVIAGGNPCKILKEINAAL